uniref:Uncharacterized protein n=1 Tax=Glossina brevipalpis TaxID=37001 RepID=A0A1A9WIB7_9MUSC
MHVNEFDDDEAIPLASSVLNEFICNFNCKILRLGKFGSEEQRLTPPPAWQLMRLGSLHSSMPYIVSEQATLNIVVTSSPNLMSRNRMCDKERLFIIYCDLIESLILLYLFVAYLEHLLHLQHQLSGLCYVTRTTNFIRIFCAGVFSGEVLSV